MKHLFCLTLALAMALALAAPARADLLWEPTDNLFFRQHTCTYEDRSYYANGSEGFITLWDAPGGSTVRAQYRNGEKLWVGYTYKDWALISCRDGRDELSGWTPLSDLYLIYDHISFEEEYGSEFRDYNGEFADYDGEDGEEFWFWEYPYAGEPREVRTVTRDMLDALLGTSAMVPNCISKVYVDSNDRTWGFVKWLYSERNFWILLDDPTCVGIMTSCIPEADDLINSGEITPPQEPVTPETDDLIGSGEIVPPPVLSGVSCAPYILVTAVVIVTAGLLKVFWKKKK